MEIVDKPNNDRLTTSVREENRERAKELIRGDRPVTFQNVSDALTVSYGSTKK